MMVIHALRQPSSSAKDHLLAVLGKGDNVTADQVSRAHKALEELGSIEYARTKAEAYHRMAHDCLDRIPDSPAMRALRELTDYQLMRIF